LLLRKVFPKHIIYPKINQCLLFEFLRILSFSWLGLSYFQFTSKRKPTPCIYRHHYACFALQETILWTTSCPKKKTKQEKQLFCMHFSSRNTLAAHCYVKQEKFLVFKLSPCIRRSIWAKMNKQISLFSSSSPFSYYHHVQLFWLLVAVNFAAHIIVLAWVLIEFTTIYARNGTLETNH